MPTSFLSCPPVLSHHPDSASTPSCQASGGIPLGPWLRAWRWLAPLALLFGLGSRGLNEPDEGRYAQMALEMLQTGDWLIPHLNGFAHMQKPPMICWLNALSMMCFGVNEWAVRLPTALAALGVIWMTFFSAKRILGERRAHLAAHGLLASFGLFILARLLTPDMVMTFWITSAIAAFLHGRSWWFFTCMGLGFLTKGPMALVVPMSAALGWRLAGGNPGNTPWVRGLLWTLALSLSWFAVVCLRDPVLLDYYLNDELLKRFASREHGRQKPWWFFLPILLVATLPYTLRLRAATRAAWEAWKNGPRARQGLLLGWTLPPLIVLSFSGSKLPTYALPILPGLIIALSLHGRGALATLKLARGALIFWISAVAVAAIPKINDWTGAQASVKPLCQQLKPLLVSQPGELLMIGARTHGVEFYLGRNVHVVEAEADRMLPPSPEAATRLHKNLKAFLSKLAGKRIYIITKESYFERHLKPLNWRPLGRSGSYLLVSNPQPAS